ncbi:unnamed protein product [Anisakis simplex]|uniref:Uncharacterized protein n=1 Tax=Anisakis simplex TaxID=6269 RepID=A0A0M3IZ42_ANISI|nr:unnamed protein product [Anisakis simplex]
MQSRNTMDSGEPGSERGGSLRRDSDADLDSLNDKITRVLEERDAQKKKIKKLEAALQREIAEKNELKMQYERLQKNVVEPKGRHKKAILKNDTTREEIQKMITTKNMELREELLKIGMQWRNEINKQILEMKQSQGELKKDMQCLFSVVRGQNEDLRTPRLHDFDSGEDLDRALRLTDNIPHMLPVSCTIKLFISPGFIRLLGYPSNNPAVWFGAIPTAYDFVGIFMWANPLESIAEKTLKNVIKQFSECYEMKQGEHGLFSPSTISDKVIQFCNQLTKSEWKYGLSYQLFYMNEEQQKSASQMKLELPTRYRFDNVNPSSDARIIAKQDDDIEDNETNIEVLRKWFDCVPCVAVRSGNKLKRVWASTPLGFYKFISLSKEVESTVKMRLCQDCISKKFWPFVTIKANDEDGLKEYNESDLWTRLDDGDGNPVIWNVIH